MYRNIVSEIGGDTKESPLTILLSVALSLGGMRITTAHESKINGATTKKVTATLKSNHTKLRTHGSLTALIGDNTVSGLKSISSADAGISLAVVIVVVVVAAVSRNAVVLMVGPIDNRSPRDKPLEKGEIIGCSKGKNADRMLIAGLFIFNSQLYFLFSCFYFYELD